MSTKLQIKKILLIQSRRKLPLAIARGIYRKVFRPITQTIVGVDGLGVPIVYYKDLGPQRNPVTVCQYALKYFTEEKKSLFWNCVDWLVKNLSKKDHLFVWEYNFPWQIYHLCPPWVSGMAQGLGIKVLVLAYKATSNKEFINIAFDALQTFMGPVEEGGVLKIDEDDGGWWYEEYASPSSIRSYVLNGHIFALGGIYELYMLTKDGMAQKLFEKGINELKRHIYEYDTGLWTYYDRLKNVANWKYHSIHINQMDYLYKITMKKVFLSFHKKWYNYALKPFAKILNQ